MKQLTLQYPLARDTDPMTSHLAAEKMVTSGALSFQEEVVYKAICDYVKYFQDDFTAKDIAERSNVTYYTIQRRLSGLRNKGKIERTGEKRDGCCVWRLV